MSRTRKREGTKNPASKFISLSGKTGKFGYWDKEKQATIELEYPINFLPLDILSTIKGYHGSLEKGIYSNEVHNITSEILNVRCFDHGQIATGYYSDIKDKIKNVGAKFGYSVYGMFLSKDNEPELVNFQLTGAALSSFIEYTKILKNDIYKFAISIVGVESAKKGATDYFIPTFDSKEVSKESSELADELDVKLQEYLDTYKIEQKTPKENEEVDNDDTGFSKEPAPEENTETETNSETPF